MRILEGESLMRKPDNKLFTGLAKSDTKQHLHLRPSRREFLGSGAEFRQIDTAGDGLISAAEAEAFDARLRPAPQLPRR